MRPIDADKLILSLNDTYLAKSPVGNETLSAQDYKESVCEGLELAMKTVEGAPTVNGWISVKDRLPDIGVKCLIYRDGQMSVAKHIANNDWITQAFFTYPTHWMPIEPPKGDEDAAKR